MSLKANYSKNLADADKAFDSLKQAIDAMKKKGESIDKYKAPEFVEVRKTIVHSLALADALSLVSSPKRQAMSAFLQNKQDPSTAAAGSTYAFHSEEIIKLLEELKAQVEEQKKDMTDKFAKADGAHTTLEASLSSTLETKQKEIEKRLTVIDDLAIKMAESKTELLNSQTLLKADEKYMTDMTTQCTTTATAWDQQSATRGDEIKAITTALSILGKRVKPAESSTSKKAPTLLQTEHATPDAAPERKALRSAKLHSVIAVAPVEELKPQSFLQTQRTGTFLQLGRMREEERRNMAVAMLQSASKQLKSPELSAIAIQIRVDPFKSVKNLLQKLIEKLLDEQNNEIANKAKCDKDIATQLQQSRNRAADVNKTKVKLNSLDSKKTELDTEIEELGDEKIPQLEESLDEATKNRDADKKENKATIKTAQEGLAALNEAIAILKDFYKKAGKAKVLLQESPITGDLPERSDDAYTGKQEGALQVFSFLEKIQAQFETTISETTAAEEAADAEFVKLERTTEADLEGYKTKKTLDEEDLEETKEAIATAKSEMKDQQKLKEDADDYLDAIKSKCFFGMTYEEKKAKIDAEIAALKKAVCVLDTEGVETDCTSV